MFLTSLAIGHVQDMALDKVVPLLNSLRTCETDVRVWRQHREIPLFGWILRKQVPFQSRMAQRRNKLVVKSVRSFTQTKTFEHVVAIALRNLNFRSLKRKPKPTRQARINPTVSLPLS
jgi:hypothetical protein